MSNPNNQFAPFSMRYNQQTNAQGVDTSTFSLSVRFSWGFYRGEHSVSKVSSIYRTFVFFANTAYTNEDGTQRLESLSPAENYSYPAKNLPPTVSLDIFKQQAAIADGLNILPEEVAIIFPKDENIANDFEKAAQQQADEFARIATENRMRLRNALRENSFNRQNGYNSHAGY